METLAAVASLIASSAGFLTAAGAILFFSGRPGPLRLTFIALLLLFSLNLLADGVLGSMADPGSGPLGFWPLLNRLVAAFLVPTLLAVAWLGRGGSLGRGPILTLAAVALLLLGLSLTALAAPFLLPRWSRTLERVNEAAWGGCLLLAVLACIVVGLGPADRSARPYVRRFMAAVAVGAILFLPFLFIRDVAPWLFPQDWWPLKLARPVFFLWGVLAALLEFARYLRDLRSRGAADRGWEALAREAGLSEREREVAAHLASGRPYREIASALFISLPTVKSHATSVYRKTGCPNRTALAERARRMAQ